MEQHDFDKAMVCLKQAVTLKRDNPLFRCDYILCLIEAQQFEECVNEMANFKKLNLRYSYFDLIYTYFIGKVRGQKDEALRNFKILMAQMPADHPTSINSKWVYCYYYGVLSVRCSLYVDFQPTFFLYVYSVVLPVPLWRRGERHCIL